MPGRISDTLLSVGSLKPKGSAILSAGITPADFFGAFCRVFATVCKTHKNSCRFFIHLVLYYFQKEKTKNGGNIMTARIIYHDFRNEETKKEPRLVKIAERINKALKEALACGKK